MPLPPSVRIKGVYYHTELKIFLIFLSYMYVSVSEYAKCRFSCILETSDTPGVGVKDICELPNVVLRSSSRAVCAPEY